MTAQQLRNSILQQAIQGRLVPQDPNDEPASVLLESALAVKQRLIKEKKIKPDKLDTPISDDEFLFQIPNGWSWVRLNNVHIIARGGSPRPIKEYLTDTSDGINWIKIGDTEKGGKYINSTREKIKPSGVSKSRMIHKGDFLLTNSMSFGRPYISNVDGCIHDGWLVISPAFGVVFDPDYLYYLLSSPFAYDQFCGKVAGAVVQNLNSDKVATSVFPLPPLAEQRRIVAKIEELMPLVEKYGKAQTELDTLNQDLPRRLRQSVLQQAIQGKLVEQDPNDEPASGIIEKIKLEKESLLSQKILKKIELDDYTLSVDEVSVPIPDGWSFVKLREICTLIDGEKRTEKHICMDAKYLRGKSSGEYLTQGKFVTKGSNIILVDGENSGEVFVTPIDGYMGSTFKQLWISQEMYTPYVMYVLRSFKETLRKDKRGAAIPHLNKDLFFNFEVGIPPLAEQRRIVAKIEELFAEIDKLK